MIDPKLAPIVFFAFNRPDHTRRSLEALKANPEAANSSLTIFCDGPRPGESAEGRERIKGVRRIVAAEQWAGQVTVRLRETNLGCAGSLLGGSSEMLASNDRVIVVEDDVLVSRGFLRFMNDALDLYRDDPKVMHIAGYGWLDPVPDWYPHSTMFLNHTSVGWGWATWKRAWDKLSTDGHALRRTIDRLRIKRYANLDGAAEIYWALKYLDEGNSDDWNCYWHSSVMVNGGYCLHPRVSLADNIGFDGSGSQSGPKDAHLLRPVVESLPVTRISVEELPELRRLMTKRPLPLRLKLRSKDLARKLYFDILGFKRRPWLRALRPERPSG